MKRTALLLTIFAAILFLYAPADAASYKIDKKHTIIGFSVKHMVISNVKGQFNEFEGSFEFDEEKVNLSKAEITMNTASVDTNEAKRDEHLRAADFFDAAKHPEITFVLNSFKHNGDGEIEGTGLLTIKGVTKEIKLTGEYNGSVNDPWGNRRAGFTVSGKINRQDFGVSFNKLLETGGLVVGDSVKLLIDVEGIKEKPKADK